MIVYYQVECTELCPCRTLQQRARADRLKSSPSFSLFVEDPIPVWQVHFLTGLEPILPLVDLHNILWGWGGLRPHHPHPGIVIVIVEFSFLFCVHYYLFCHILTSPPSSTPGSSLSSPTRFWFSRNCDHCWPLLTIIDHRWPLLTIVGHCWPPVQWQNAEAQLELESDTVTFLRG